MRLEARNTEDKYWQDPQESSRDLSVNCRRSGEDKQSPGSRVGDKTTCPDGSNPHMGFLVRGWWKRPCSLSLVQNYFSCYSHIIEISIWLAVSKGYCTDSIF